MRDNEVSPDQLDRVFHFDNDGSFTIHDVPGRSKKEKTLNTYILAGLGRYLTTNEKRFEDSLARGFCESVGFFDAGNHAAHLKKYRDGDFTGSKKQGYTLTTNGIRRGAALVKEFAGASK